MTTQSVDALVKSVDVLVIGGGATGAAALYDLARRGVRALLVEQLDLTTGTSGRYHGLLHSGARYAVRDPETAQECIQRKCDPAPHRPLCRRRYGRAVCRHAAEIRPTIPKNG